MKTCYEPIEQIMRLESFDVGKKSSHSRDSNLGSHLLSNALVRLRDRANLICMRKLFAKYIKFLKAYYIQKSDVSGLESQFSNGSLCFDPSHFIKIIMLAILEKYNSSYKMVQQNSSIKAHHLSD